jgi:hypothetical protein
MRHGVYPKTDETWRAVIAEMEQVVGAEKGDESGR